MTFLRWLITASLLAAAMAALGWSIGRWCRDEPAPSGNTAARGALLFQAHCASCHGPEGRGDGSAAAALTPPPRDWTARPWRFEPTLASIRRITRDGIPGTPMPAFQALLSPADLDELAAHVQRLASDAAQPTPVASERTRLLRDAGFADLPQRASPRLSVRSGAGRTETLANWSGRLVIVHFWGTGCVHCLKEIPALRELEKAHADRLVVLNVCTDEDDPAAAQKILDRAAPGATAYVDATGLGHARFEVQSLPTAWLISPTGKSVGRASGARDWTGDPIKKLIEHLLASP